MTTLSLPRLAKGEEADICLLLEGTYPYVQGGVSSWVHQIITELPQFRFAVVFVGDVPENYAELHYTLPDNVVHFQNYFLFAKRELPPPRQSRGRREPFDSVAELHDYFHNPCSGCSAEVMRQFAAHIGKPGGLPHKDFLYSKRAWQQITSSYQKYADEGAFLEFFWTVRTMHSPLFFLAEALDSMPMAKVYHAVSTGYAGLLGTLLHYRRQRSFILTEHGIYTKERKIDLSQMEWIQDAEDVFAHNVDEGLGYLRRLWIRFFEGLGHLTYEAATQILSITNGNRMIQIADGAPEERIRVIPNGVNLQRFIPLRQQRPPQVPMVLGFVGRIVPIKDIKTLIRAMRTVCIQIPEAELWMIGGEEEDPEYARECHDLVQSLDLRGQIKFLGFRQVEEIFQQLGLMVLTSISEGLPLVILEAFASGVPVVATDVGACRELVEGGTAEDRAIGRAGGIATIADPEAVATEIVTLLQDPQRWQQAQRAAIERVERYYSEEDLLEAYRQVYTTAIESSVARQG